MIIKTLASDNSLFPPPSRKHRAQDNGDVIFRAHGPENLLDSEVIESYVLHGKETRVATKSDGQKLKKMVPPSN